MTEFKENLKTPRTEITTELCKGCYLCLEVCPQKIIHISKSFNKLGYQYIEVDAIGCTGCAICYYTCPEPGAIAVYKKQRGE